MALQQRKAFERNTAPRFEFVQMSDAAEIPEHKPVGNKKAGESSEVFPFEIEDLKNILTYFLDNDKMVYYLLLTMSCNMARRIGDILDLRWRDIFRADGSFRDEISIVEEKTKKFANPHLNKVCREAISLYIEKTGCDVSADDYSGYVFMQTTGNYAGRVVSQSGYLKALKRAGDAVGVTYNIGTHSGRKTFGKMTRILHPGDNDVMPMLQSIYNHSDTKITNRYIGLTKERAAELYEDFGDFFGDYVTGDKEYRKSESIIVHMDSGDLHDILKFAYELGLQNAGFDAMTHVNAIADIDELVEVLRK